MLSPDAAAAAAQHAIRGGGGEARQRVANYAMAAAAGHGLIALALALVKQRLQEADAVREDYDVLFTTGDVFLMQKLKSLMFCHRARCHDSSCLRLHAL